MYTSNGFKKSLSQFLLILWGTLGIGISLGGIITLVLFLFLSFQALLYFSLLLILVGFLDLVILPVFISIFGSMQKNTIIQKEANPQQQTSHKSLESPTEIDKENVAKLFPKASKELNEIKALIKIKETELREKMKTVKKAIFKFDEALEKIKSVESILHHSEIRKLYGSQKTPSQIEIADDIVEFTSELNAHPSTKKIDNKISKTEYNKLKKEEFKKNISVNHCSFKHAGKYEMLLKEYGNDTSPIPNSEKIEKRKISKALLQLNKSFLQWLYYDVLLGNEAETSKAVEFIKMYYFSNSEKQKNIVCKISNLSGQRSPLANRTIRSDSNAENYKPCLDKLKPKTRGRSNSHNFIKTKLEEKPSCDVIDFLNEKRNRLKNTFLDERRTRMIDFLPHSEFANKKYMLSQNPNQTRPRFNRCNSTAQAMKAFANFQKTNSQQTVEQTMQAKGINRRISFNNGKIRLMRGSSTSHILPNQDLRKQIFIRRNSKNKMM